MKKILLIAISSLFLFCQSFDNSLIDEKDHIDSRLSAYEIILNEESIRAAFPDSHYDDNYRTKVKELITNNLQIKNKRNLEKKGYLSVLVRDVEIIENRLLYLAAPFSIFGIPSHSIECIVNIDFAVMTNEGRIIQAFTVNGIKSIQNSAFYGYKDFQESEAAADTAFAKMAVFTALKRAMVDAKIQIATRAPKL